MAITTFSELKTAVASWSKRSDLTTLIPDFITLCEVRLGRSFAPRGTETETALVTVASSRYVALPTGMQNPLGLWLRAYTPRVELTQMLPETIPVSAVNGYPDYWCIDGTNIAFDKPCSSAWAFDFRYQAPFALSDSSPTNYVLTYNPDLYLFGTMMEVCMYTEDDAGVSKYQQRYADALARAIVSENANKSGAILMTELVSPRQMSNIFAG